MNKVDENKLRILNEMKKFIHIFITYPSKNTVVTILDLLIWVEYSYRWERGWDKG